MKIEENSYWIRYRLHKEKEYAEIHHYGDVWDRGYLLEDYSVSDCCIYYEDASYNTSPYKDYCGTRIIARKFHCWINEIERTKKKLIELGKGAGTATVNELKEGDCVFCDIPPYDPEYEYDYEWFCFWEIISVDNDIISAKEIVIAPYSFRCSKGVTRIERSEEEYWLNDALKNGCIKLIDKSVFLRATEIFNPLPKKIMAEIRKEVECIER
jgi:hypothetical protein